MKGEDLAAFIGTAISNASLVSKSCAFYVWAPALHEGGMVLKGIQEAGFHVQSQVVWRKDRFVLGRCDYHWQHESAWYGYFGQGHAWYGGRDKGSVWDCKKMQAMEFHPTQKPVELAEIGITNSSKGGDIVLDPFAGSGFVLIASQILKRRAFCMELSPRHVDTMIVRWQEFSGDVATLASTGQTYRELAKERLR